MTDNDQKELMLTDEQEVDPMNNLFPRWTEFNRLGNDKEIQEAVRKFFGDARATSENFLTQFGVDLNEFLGYYLESGLVDAPQGPFTPTRITPILVIRQSRSGQSFAPHIFKHEGLLHDSRMLAWVDSEAWDVHVQDTFAEEIKQQAAKERESRKRLAAQTDAEKTNGEE